MDKTYIPATVFISLAIFGIIGIIYMTFARNNAVIYFATVTVPSNGLVFKNGIIESPALILEVNENDFLAFAKAYNTIVYGYKNQFYTFNEDMTVAYRYTPIMWFQ